MHTHNLLGQTSVGDLIGVRGFPAVVQAADVRALRNGEHADAAHDFISGYLGFDERSQHALSTTIRSLSGDAGGGSQGGAFFLNGVFGSGKSHLLGLLALLSDNIGYEAFAPTHPQLAPLLGTFTPRLVVHFSLDEYDATRFSLEDIFWREVHAEWQRRCLPAAGLALPSTGSRTEYFAALEEAICAQGLHGLVVCIDELSLFLSAKEHRALQGDAAFLQFLGQRARRHHAPTDAALWVFAALQKTFEDIGDLEAYSLSQIRDRFTTLPLSLAHLPSLIEHRLVIKKDSAALQRVSHESFANLSRALPRLDFGVREWEQLYPFHPVTVALLEQVVARFFSRTRSAVLFCAGALEKAIQDHRNAADTILPDALFDYVEPELEAHPDLRSLTGVWASWRESLPILAADGGDAVTLERLMKALLLFKIAGAAPSLVQLANAIALDAHLPGDGNYEYTRVLLEKLRTRGSYLAVERNEGAFADRYAIDLGTRVGEMARRITMNMLQSLPVGDTRIAHYSASCCHDDTFPLAHIIQKGSAAESFSVMWRNAPRRIAVAVWSELLTASVLTNRLAALAQPGNAEDALLVVVPPFAGLEEAAQRCCDEAMQTLPGDADNRRWRAALILWTPRQPTNDEWELAREATAQHLLESDPQLLDNRRGRAILQHLKTDAPQREAALRRVGVRLLREGQISTGPDAVIDAAELAGDSSWTATLEALAEFALFQIFPKFESVAPRMRVLTSSNADALCLEILRRPVGAPYFAPSLERAARAIAEPLGVAKAEQGRWRIEAPREDLAQEIKSLTPGAGMPLSIIEATLAKSQWGLAPEQTAVAICALLRSGDLLAFEARGTALAPMQIGMPLRRAIRTLQPGELLDNTSWSRIQTLMQELGLAPLREVSFTHQEQARAALLNWRESAVAETELAQARMHQLRRQLGHSAAQWSQTEAAWEQIVQLLNALSDKGSAVDFLKSAAAVNLEPLRPALTTWRTIMSSLESNHAALLGIHAMLTNPALAVPPDLQEARATLLTRFSEGESLLQDNELLQQAETWRAAYAAHYRDWHSIQHDAARWMTYRRLAAGDTLRALERLESISTRSFTQGHTIRAMLEEELDKSCGRDGSLHGGEISCATCQLRWGERLRLRDPREIESAMEQGMEALRLSLREAPVHQYLNRHAIGANLLEWTDSENSDSGSLLPLLRDDTLHVLNEAFRPRRCVTRSADALLQSLLSCRTSADFHTAFKLWLDNNEGLDDDDEVVLEDSK